MADTRHQARVQLDAVRELLKLTPTGRVCGCCGASRPGHKAPCPLCDGRPVSAVNLVKAIREVVAPTQRAFAYELHDRGKVRTPGQVETGTMLTSGRVFNGNED